MKKIKKTAIYIITALLFSTALLPFNTFASTEDELSLSVSYEAKCGEPTVFTLNASGGSGNYMYYLGNITRNGEDGQYFVMDPSKLPPYQEDNTFQFTFCASGVYTLQFYVMDKGTMPIKTKREIVKVVINDPAYPTIEAIADSVAEQCKAICKTEYERALWLHDWLIDNCEYDYSYLYCGSEGALARGTGTCEAYHRAYTMLLNRVGIENGRVEGNGHVWTAVKIDGNWYQVDVTWDDNGYTNHSYENYLYFGLNDTIMNLVHSDHKPNSSYLSNSLENNYFIKSGEIHKWSDPLMEAIKQNLDQEKTSFTVPVKSSMPESYQNVIYNLAAYQLADQSWASKTHTANLDISFSSGEMQIEAIYNHTWDDGAITKPPTATTDGIKTYTCTACGETKTETIKTTGLETPVLKAVVNANGSFTLSWNKVPEADKYELYIRNNDGSYRLLKSTTDTSYTTAQAAYGKEYTYKVRAVTSKNSSAASAFSSVVSAKNTKRLQAPTLKVTVNSNGSFTLLWNAVTGATSYEVYIKNADGSYRLMKTTTATSYTTAQAAYGKEYSYKIKAVTSKNSSAASAFSSVVSAKNTKKLQAPTLKATVNSNGSFTLSWNTVTGATSYEFYIKQADGTYRLMRTTSATSVTTGIAAKGKTYTYKVRAVVKSNSSAASNDSSVVNATRK